jgi:hypothetical protein
LELCAMAATQPNVLKRISERTLFLMICRDLYRDPHHVHRRLDSTFPIGLPLLSRHESWATGNATMTFLKQASHLLSRYHLP